MKTFQGHTVGSGRAVIQTQGSSTSMRHRLPFTTSRHTGYIPCGQLQFRKLSKLLTVCEPRFLHL